jgi:hypothetical protein
MTGRPTYTDLAKRWKDVQRNESTAYRAEPERKRGRATATAATLEAMYFATGNKIYANAFEAMQKDGFVEVGDNGVIKNAGKSWKYRPLHERNAEAVYIDCMDNLIRRGMPHRHAAARVAVTYFIPGKTFNAVVTALEATYLKFQRSREKECLKAQSA